MEVERQNLQALQVLVRAEHRNAVLRTRFLLKPPTISQEELLKLKETYAKSLHLKKTGPADGKAAPFPIAATFSIDPPVTAVQYDVSTVRVTVTIQKEILTACSSNLDLSSPPVAQKLASAVKVGVQSADLPPALTAVIQDKLKSAWLQNITSQAVGNKVT